MRPVRVAIEPGAADAIRWMAADSADGLETGGILLGRGPDTNGIVHVARAGDPGPDAQREPGFFLRDLRHAQRLAEEAWSSRRAVWVGEWHTHLHRDPRPSAVDLDTYGRLLGSADLKFEVFVAIIVVADARLGWRMPRLTPWALEITESAPTKPSLGLVSEIDHG